MCVMGAARAPRRGSRGDRPRLRCHCTSRSVKLHLQRRELQLHWVCELQTPAPGQEAPRLQVAGPQPLATDQVPWGARAVSSASSPARPRPWPWMVPRGQLGCHLSLAPGAPPALGLTRLPTCARQPGVTAEGLTMLSGLVGPKLERCFFPEGPAITVPCGGALNVKANAFLMFLSSQKKTLKWQPADASEAARPPRHWRHRCGCLGHGWGLQKGPRVRQSWMPAVPATTARAGTRVRRVI